MENYNGLYEASYGITVKSDNHKDCLFTYNRFKHLTAAFNYGNISIYESKSARKGDVLSRDIQIIFTGYADQVLIFKTAIDSIICDINISSAETTATLYRAIVIRENARRNLIEQTS